MTSCTGLTGGQSAEVRAARDAVFDDHASRAIEFERTGELAEALNNWRIALAVKPDSNTAQQQALELERSIDERVNELMSAADNALGLANEERAASMLLQALALDPDNQKVMQQLIGMQRSRLGRRVPTTPRTADVATATENTASVTGRGNAEEKFRAGVKLFESDPDSAEALFNEALRLDPNHLGARAYLQLLAEKPR